MKRESVDNPEKRMKLTKESFSEQLRIVVGPTKTEFFAQRTIICHHSAFFQVACSKRWPSGRSNIISLEEDEPEIVAIFLAWAYTGRIETASHYIEVPVDATLKHENLQRQWDQLAQCFILGQVIQATSFQNAAVDLLVANGKQQHNARKGPAGTDPPNISRYNAAFSDSLEYAYENTLPGSQLRTLILDIIVAEGSAVHLCGLDLSRVCFQDYTKELATLALTSSSRFNHPWNQSPCRYHTHPGHPLWYSCTAIQID